MAFALDGPEERVKAWADAERADGRRRIAEACLEWADRIERNEL